MRHKLLRMGLGKKYKRAFAAFAGAAVMSTAMLHGVPVAKAQTPEPSDSHYRSEANHRWDNNDRRSYSDPVQVVRDNAGAFGFSSSARFSLLSNTGSKATVEVRSNGQTFKVDLRRSGNSWEITAVRGIGDSTHPATYTSAGLFPYQGVVTAPVVTPSNGYTLYSSDTFSGWAWGEGAYPAGTTYGVVTADPRTNTSVNLPDKIRNAMYSFNFDRQFAVYAHLGSVNSNGYGIGIERIVKSGNNLVVTVRFKSPNASAATSTNTDAYIAIDRSALDLTQTSNITFVDANGATLSTATLTPR